MPRFFVPVLLCLLVLQPAAAGELARANSLTPKEVREGWLLLFDGETTYGWNVQGEARVADGLLILGGKEKPTRATFGTQFGAYEVRFEFQGTFGPQARVLLSRFNHNLGKWQNQAAAEWFDAQGILQQDSTSFQVQKRTGGESDSSLFGLTGGSPLAIVLPAGNTMRLRNIKLKPLGLKAIFNGRNQAGWKEYPGKKSKFTVTPEGWLNVKNGPGDLQTVGRYKDFVLQLECISNGKHLNSGIFFRAIPGEYQQGYEAQIRNEFTPYQPRSYKLDKYDPITHKKIGTELVLSTAVDYGTGAIYRRMPARKQASKDGEWFTMTVVAQGNHFATWVNGIQVCDCTDHRPLNRNARQGCCLDAGAISIQGHDPTTDLSFRHLRIAELPAPPKEPQP